MQVSIVGRGATGGRMEKEVDETRGVYSKSELEQMICEALGGRAAEIVCYGEHDGLSTGASGDLRNASYWATRMVTEFGMSEEMGPLACRTPAREANGLLALKIHTAARRIVEGEQKRAIEMITENKASLDRLVNALMERNRLTGAELEEILPAV